jgi:lipid-A-disaccharide synthase-like uncharacterized protein
MEWLGAIIDHLKAMPMEEVIWVSIGLGGQAMFSMRFIIQWIVSEKKRDSVVPIAFWYFSLGGATILLSYGIWRADPVIILGQSTGFVIYLRNLYFIHRRKSADLDVANPDGGGMASEPVSEDAVDDPAQSDPRPAQATAHAGRGDAGRDGA